METISNNGILEPRIYQLFGDRIDSKQAMEPLAISIGPGPVSGFNNFSWNPTENTVTFTSADDPNSLLRVPGKNRGLLDDGGYKAISDIANNLARPINAHITRDGLLHTSSSITLPFTPYQGWPTNLDGTPITGTAFMLKAKHEYQNQVHSVEDNPVTFEIIDLKLKNINPWDLLSTNSYATLCEDLGSTGLLDLAKETVIGIYIIGWDLLNWGATDETKYQRALMKDMNWSLSVVFYNSRRPCLVQSPFDAYQCKAISDNLEYLTSQSVGYLSLKTIGTIVSEFKIRYRDQEIIPVRLANDSLSIDSSGLAETGEGYLTLIYDDRSGSISQVDFDTAVFQATIDRNFVASEGRPRMEFVDYTQESIPITSGTTEPVYTRYKFNFWVDKGGNIHNLSIRGIVKVNK